MHSEREFPKPHIVKRFGGRGRDRTGDPLLAKQVLSQLSYTPMRCNHYTLNSLQRAFSNCSNFYFRSIRSDNGLFRGEFEPQTHFSGYLLAKIPVVPQLGITVCHRLSRVAKPEPDEVLGD
jgi:hypothetical protein